MTNDEINKKQEETLNNLKKYNKTRNTEIVDDPEEIKWEAPTRELVIEDGNVYDSFFAPDPEEKLLDDFFEELAKDDPEPTFSSNDPLYQHGNLSDDPEEDSPKLTLVHREESEIYVEDPSEYTEIEVVPYSEPDNDFYEEDEPIEDIEQAWDNATIRGVTALEAQDTLNKERGISVAEETEPEGYNYYVPPLLCQWCGALAYPGQIHGLGHCKEKIVYES